MDKYETLSQFKNSGYTNILNAFTHLSKNIDRWIQKNQIEASFFDGENIEKRLIRSLVDNTTFEYQTKHNADISTYDGYWCSGVKIYKFIYRDYWMDINKINFLSKSTLNRLAKLVWIVNKNGINIKTVKHFTKFLYLKFAIHRVRHISNVDKQVKIINKFLPRSLFKKEYILDIDYKNEALKRLSKFSILEKKQTARWWYRLKYLSTHI